MSHAARSMAHFAILIDSKLCSHTEAISRESIFGQDTKCDQRDLSHPKVSTNHDMFEAFLHRFCGMAMKYLNHYVM